MASQDKAATFSVVAKDAASSVLRGVGKEMGRLGKTGGAVFKTLAVAAAAVATAITTAAAATVKFTQMAIQAAISDDAEQQKLIATLKARGQTTEQATKRVNELIAAGAELAFTDSEVRAGYEVATRFAKKYSNQQKILTTAQDLSRSAGIDLATATKTVGRAFDGNGRALGQYGITLEKGVKGTKALGEINKKVGGVAGEFAKTFSGQFGIVKNSINETVEAIGGAIGGGEGLPTFTRLLSGITPVVKDIIGEINKNLPNIEKFSRELVEKFLAKLPGYVATAKRELPILIQQAKDFIGGVAGFAKDIASFLGPDGLITAGIAGVGFKMGGLAGGIGAIFAEKFIKMGIDPITATITGTIGGAITAGVVQGFGSAVAQAAVKAFLGLFKSVPITPSVPVSGGGVPPIGTAPLAQTVLGVTAASIATVAAGAMAAVGVVAAAKVLYDQIFTPAEQEKNMMDNYAKLQARIKSEGLAAVTSSAGGVYGSNVSGGSSDYLNRAISNGVVQGFKAVPMAPPIDLTNRLTLTLDGRVVAQSVSQYLGITTNSRNDIRNTGRGR